MYAGIQLSEKILDSTNGNHLKPSYWLAQYKIPEHYTKQEAKLSLG